MTQNTDNAMAVIEGLSSWALVEGDCLDVLRAMPDACVDAVVTDPPYGLGNHEPTVEEIIAYLQGANLDTGGDFMGKKWMVPSVAIWCEVARVCKPGAHVLCFGGTRTFDLISLGLRAASFENRDTISGEGVLRWIYGSGFPKSLDVSKAIDKTAGAEREVVGTYKARGFSEVSPTDDGRNQWAAGEVVDKVGTRTAPATPEAAQWSGWGTALKPSWEPVLVFRKPLIGTVAANVIKHGTGALNIDGCRVATGDDLNGGAYSGGVRPNSAMGCTGEVGGTSSMLEEGGGRLDPTAFKQPAGRWPANLVLSHTPECRGVGTKRVDSHAHYTHARHGKVTYSGQLGDGPDMGNPLADADGKETVEAWECSVDCPVRLLDEQSGSLTSGALSPSNIVQESSGWSGGSRADRVKNTFKPNTGGASRFFPTFNGDSCNHETANTAATPSSPQNPVEGSALSNAATAAPSEETPGESCQGPFTSEMERASALNSAPNTKQIPNSETGCSSGSPLVSTSPSSNHARSVGPLQQIDTTTTIQSRRSSGGCAVAAISGTTPQSMEVGALDCRFRYTAKASRSERNLGGVSNVHATVKPLDLMRWLCRLITPPGAVVLDPFAGSGSTVVAALREGFRCIGIEREPEYVAIARHRIEEDAPLMRRPRPTLPTAAPATRELANEQQQRGLFDSLPAKGDAKS